MMSEKDFTLICSKIDENKELFNSISQDIWAKPELLHKEVNAHDTLTNALSKCGFKVENQYLLPTAFKAVHSSATGGGPTIAVLLEYDALPEIGHACGHNLIAEAGLAASAGIKAAMEADPMLAGTLIVLGTPAEEGGGGKIQMMKLGALEGVDAAMMVHPARFTSIYPPTLSLLKMTVDFKGKEAHAFGFPWEGPNALDAAVAAYQNISLLRQQIKPSYRIHGIISKGGVAPNVIPGESRIELVVRAPTKSELKDLLERVKDCLESGAKAAGCSVSIDCDQENSYENLVINKVMGDIYQTYAGRLGLRETNLTSMPYIPAGSTDMGNVSHVVPSIHPVFALNTEANNHTKEFTEAAGSPNAQQPTLAAAKAMAMTALKLMRCPKTLEEVKKQFEIDIALVLEGS